MELQTASLIWNAPPEIFSWAPIRWYGLLFAIGFLGAYQVLQKIFKKENIDLKRLESLMFYMIIGTVVGARLGHCLFYEPEAYLPNPIRILKIWEGGLASHGAAIGILTALVLYLRRNKDFSFMFLADRLSVAIPFSAACVRIGNFINSEILGKAADLPWAVVFQRVDLVPRHPAQLYEAIAYLSLFALTSFLYFKKSEQIRPGLLTGIFLTTMFSARFLIEYVKDVQVQFEHSLILHMGQFLSLPFIILGVYLIVNSLKKAKTN
jgi:prolipoprotein diacylglyceryl transferase